jgi:7-keto-8-aminopelargonate synthetase-like enzyme
MGRVDIITGTLGKALGGAMGGYTAKKKLLNYYANVLDLIYFQIL